MSKRIIAGLLMIVLVFSLTGCTSFKINGKEMIKDKDTTVTEQDKTLEEREKELELREKELELQLREKELEERESALQNGNNVVTQNPITEPSKNEEVEATQNPITTPIIETNDRKYGTTEYNPAKLGEFVAVSVYNGSTSSVETIGVKIEKIIKGAEARDIVKEYMDNSSFYVYEEPSEGLQWVVFKCYLDYSDYTVPSWGYTNSFHDINLRTVDKAALYSDSTYLISFTYDVTPKELEVELKSDSSDRIIPVYIATSTYSNEGNLLNPILEIGHDYEGYLNAFIEYPMS